MAFVSALRRGHDVAAVTHGRRYFKYQQQPWPHSSKICATMPESQLTDELKALEPKLAIVLTAIAASVAEVAEVLRLGDTNEAGSTNTHGDRQLNLDVAADTLIFAKLRECGAVETASSEETSDLVPLGGHGFSVAFDPVDGSSIVPANFAVGSIFGVWPGGALLGKCGREQAAAAYAVYGPRTALVLSRPRMETTAEQTVQEFVLTAPADAERHTPAQWRLVRSSITIPPESRTFAPANLRAAAENAAYAELIRGWMADKYTLRYTGGMVPDVHHILAKGGGVFCNPRASSAPAKLRLLYEAAPMAFVVEAAGGGSHDGRGSVLDRPVGAADDRIAIALGSAREVRRCVAALAEGA